MKLTKQDRKDIADFTKAALEGLLADHQHCTRFEGLTCGQSTCEWACLFGIETFLRLKRKMRAMERGKSQFPVHVRVYAAARDHGRP